MLWRGRVSESPHLRKFVQIFPSNTYENYVDRLRNDTHVDRFRESLTKRHSLLLQSGRTGERTRLQCRLRHIGLLTVFIYKNTLRLKLKRRRCAQNETKTNDTKLS